MLILFFLFSVATSQICPVYECASLANNQCISPQGEKVLVDTCDSFQYCPITSPLSPSYCALDPNATSYAWPGEPCKSSICQFGICNGTVCVGQSYNETCKVPDDCEPGLSCFSGICDYLIPIGFGTCKSDFDCVNSAGCTEGKCVKYYSIDEAYPVNCQNNVSEFCASGACYQGYCLGQLSNDNGQGAVCSSRSDCTCSEYSMPIFPIYFYQDCECGLDGQKYCNLFPGDLAMQDYLYYVKMWMESEVMELCNTVRRFALPCIKAKWDKYSYSAFVYYQMLTKDYTYIMTGETCLLDVYAPLFEQFEKDFKSSAIFYVISLLWTLAI